MGMSNTWFQFRQFRIEQDKCAMKITTDACIQGAWTPIIEQAAKVLDIGTGTGLLSLMLAQRSTSISIDAVEYDEAAAKQATDNVSSSGWSDRIKVLHQDIREYKSDAPYDLIICNPPFYTDSLLSESDAYNLARHSVSLNRHELATAITANLANDGQLSILLPIAEYKVWKELAAGYGLYELKCLHILHRPGATAKRVVSIMGRKTDVVPGISTLTIKGDTDQYTPQFAALLCAFYLQLE